jgi:hypothetical protein
MQNIGKPLLRFSCETALPNCVEDGIQMHIFFNKDYYELDVLKDGAIQLEC